MSMIIWKQSALWDKKMESIDELFKNVYSLLNEVIKVWCFKGNSSHCTMWQLIIRGKSLI